MKCTLSRFRCSFLPLVFLSMLFAPAAMLHAATPTIAIIGLDANNVTTSDVAQVKVTLGAGTGSYTLRLRTVGWDSQESYRHLYPGVISAQIVQTMVPIRKYGSYDVYAELLDATTSAVLQSATTRVIRPVPVPALTFEQRRNSYIGSDTHVYADWDMLAQFGIHWARDYEFGGAGDASGNMSSYQAVWNAAKAHNITVLPVIQHNLWNTTQTGYVNDPAYITATLKRFALALPEVELWEIGNEDKYQFITNMHVALSSYHDNLRMYIHACAAGLAQAGTSRVVLDGSAGIQTDTTNEVLKTTGVSPVVASDFDVVNYHHYAGSAPPETNNHTSCPDGNLDTGWTSSSQTILNLMQSVNNIAHAAGKKAWLTEFGYAEYLGRSAVGLRNQADYLAREYLLARSVGTDKVFWYYDRDDDSGDWIAHMGLRDSNGVARPHCAVLAAVSKFTALSTVTGSGTLGANSWYVSFAQPDGTTLTAAWTMSQLQPFSATTAAAAYDMFGNRIPTTSLMIGPDVTYLLYLPQGANLAPTAEAGDFQLIQPPQDTVTLNGSAMDDGMPASPGHVTTTWSKVSGPGTVTFGDASALSTTATFSQAGTYVLRLTANDGQLQGTDDVTVTYDCVPSLAYTHADVGGGLTAFTFYISNNDGLAMSYALTLALQGAGGATINQVTCGDIGIDGDVIATRNDGKGTPPYSKAKDTWVYSPWYANPVLGISPLDGSYITGIVEGANSYQLSCGTGSNSQYGTGVNIVHVVAGGNVQWTGSISRNNVLYNLSGATNVQTSAIPGDFNGDHYVDQADYTVWADYYGTDGAAFAQGSRGAATGSIGQQDYTTWADHYGQGTPPAAITVSQPSAAAVQATPVTGGAKVGDFNGDGRVDQADYTAWADNQGRVGANLLGDANGDGRVDQADLTAWMDHFGEGVNR